MNHEAKTATQRELTGVSNGG